MTLLLHRSPENSCLMTLHLAVDNVTNVTMIPDNRSRLVERIEGDMEKHGVGRTRTIEARMKTNTTPRTKGND